MAEVIVTRPAAAATRTAEHLTAAGHTPLVTPLLAVVPRPPARLTDGSFAGFIVTSAAALTAIADHVDLPALRRLTLWAVGSRTGAQAAALGFEKVRSPEGGAGAEDLAALLRREGARGTTYLYLSAERTAVDLVGKLGADGITVIRRAVYRTDVVATLPTALERALRAGTPAAVLHFSIRSARAYVDLTAAAGLAEAALRPAQLCLSAGVAGVLRATGATTVASAPTPTEAALLALLGRQGG